MRLRLGLSARRSLPENFGRTNEHNRPRNEGSKKVPKHGERGQVAMAMGSGLILVLTIVVAAFVLSQLTSSMDIEDVTNPVEREVRAMASTIFGPLALVALIVAAVVVISLFTLFSCQAFGGE